METSQFDPRSIVGRETVWVEVTADEKTLERYLMATGEQMLSSSPEGGEGRAVLPPGFLSALRPDIAGLIPDFGRVRLNLGNEFEWLAPVFVGERLRRKTRIADVTEKQGKSGTMWLIAVETEYRRPDGQVVAIARATTARR